MNFSKHRVTERKMLSEMMEYCNDILSHRRKNDENYSKLHTCISTRTGGVEIRKQDELVIVIRYDDLNDHYYFLEKKVYNDRILTSRIIINDKKDFYAYFDEVVEDYLGKMQ